MKTNRFALFAPEDLKSSDTIAAAIRRGHQGVVVFTCRIEIPAIARAVPAHGPLKLEGRGDSLAAAFADASKDMPEEPVTRDLKWTSGHSVHYGFRLSGPWGSAEQEPGTSPSFLTDSTLLLVFTNLFNAHENPPA